MKTRVTRNLSDNEGVIEHAGTATKFLSLIGAGTRMPQLGADGALGDSGILVSSIVTSTNYGNILYVSPSGNNVTAQRGRIDKPYATINAAWNAAVNGDVIAIYGGTFSETVSNPTLNDGIGITLAFYGGARLIGDVLVTGRYVNIVSDGTGILDGNVFLQVGNDYSVYVSGMRRVKGLRFQKIQVFNTYEIDGDVRIVDGGANRMEISNVKLFNHTSTISAGYIFLNNIELYTWANPITVNGSPVSVFANKVRFKGTSTYLTDSRFGRNEFIDCEIKVSGNQPFINDGYTLQSQTIRRCSIDCGTAASAFVYSGGQVAQLEAVDNVHSTADLYSTPVAPPLQSMISNNRYFSNFNLLY